MALRDEIRHSNLCLLITEAGSQIALAERAGTSEAYISQLFNRLRDSKTGTVKNIGNQMARKLEIGMGKPEGWMDQPRATEAAITYNVQPVRDRGARPVISWVRAGAFDDIADPFHPGEADRWEAPMYRSGPRAFWLVVDGDSMTAPTGAPHSFPEGTLIHCDPDIEGIVGRYVIAKDVASQRATFKLLTSDGLMQYLKPLNPAYPTIAINNGNIRIIATVTEWRIGGKL